MNAATVLLVEDNPDDELLTKRAFKAANLVNEITVARDGQEALDLLFGEHPLTPAAVLLDLKLPKVGGLEVLAALRADPRTKLLPVVILTSSDEDEDLIRAYAQGANSYVRKPVGFVEFSEAARRVGVYWMMMNEPVPSTADGSERQGA
jgi:two-component system, response regulator